MVVGHVPCKISRVCALFLERNGAITCTITGPRRRSADLPQGGMELPCVLAFSGGPSDLLKVKRIMATLSIQPPPKQASNDEPEQECSDSDNTSGQPLLQKCENPAEPMELDATEQHTKLSHVGYVHQCLHKCEPCGFSTFFNVSVATNATARDARVTSRTNFQ